MTKRKRTRFGVAAIAVWWVLPLVSVLSMAAPRGDQRLVDALKQGNTETVQSLLNEKVDVNAPESDGTSPLAWAVYWDDPETVELLLGAGANVNAANDYGVTPLFLACGNRNAAMVRKLLEAGADPNARLRAGGTPLMACARTGSVEAVKALLDRGADANAKENHRGQTALMTAAAEKHPDVVRTLIESGAEADARSKGGFTALLFAAQQGDQDAAKLLVAAGADVNETTPEGLSPLLVASASGHEDFSIFLLDQGADANAATADGATALHYAVLKGLSIASGVRYDPAVAHLFRPNMEKLVRALLAHGANPNVQMKKKPVGATPFLLAAVTYDAGVMRDLAAGGADPLLATKTNTTPLMMAAGSGRREDRTEDEERMALEAVKAAVELGADVNAADENGQTAMHAAAYTGSDAIIQVLADAGAAVEVKDKFGQTPLSIAKAYIPETVKDFALRPFIVHESTASLLLKLGAKPLAVPSSQPQGGSAIAPNAVQ